MKQSNEHNKKFLVIFSIAIIATGGAYFLWSQYKPSLQDNKSSTSLKSERGLEKQTLNPKNHSTDPSKNIRNIYSIKISDITDSQEECGNIFGGFQGHGCVSEESRKNIYNQIVKLKNNELTEEDWKKFNPLSIGGGLKNSEYSKLDNKNGIVYILSGMDGASGDMPLTGGSYQLISLFFENDEVYVVRDRLGDLAYVDAIFNSEERKNIIARAKDNENYSADINIFFDEMQNTVFEQLSNNIRNKYVEGFFTVHEQQKIINYIKSFKNKVENYSID